MHKHLFLCVKLIMNISNDLKRLKFEDIIWIVFIVLSVLNILGDKDEEEYLLTKDNNYKKEANRLFEITLVVTFFIYLYFLVRNYNAYKNSSEKDRKDYLIKLLGSAFFLGGNLCLLYFQEHYNNFIGTPA